LVDKVGELTESALELLDDGIPYRNMFAEVSVAFFLELDHTKRCVDLFETIQQLVMVVVNM
jgi:hypothetical protein